MDILRSLNWVDVLVIIIIFRISYVAFQEGLSHQIFPVLAGIVTIIFSLNYYNKIGLFLSENLLKIWPAVANFLSFLMLAVITGFAFKLLKAVLDKIIHVEWNPLIERFGGLVFGMARAGIMASLVLIAIALAPFPYLQRSIRDKSMTGMHILRIGPEIYEKTSGLIPGASPFTKEGLIKDLIADKSIAPKATKKEKVREWEKI